MNGIFRIITCYAKIQLFSQKNINIAGCRFFLAIICYYFSTFVVRIWQIQISKVGIRMKNPYISQVLPVKEEVKETTPLWS